MPLFIHGNISRQLCSLMLHLIHAATIYCFLTIKLTYTRTEAFSVPCPVTISSRDLKLIRVFLNIHKAGNDSWAVINIWLIKSFNWVSKVNKKLIHNTGEKKSRLFMHWQRSCFDFPYYEILLAILNSVNLLCLCQVLHSSLTVRN